MHRLRPTLAALLSSVLLPLVRAHSITPTWAVVGTAQTFTASLDSGDNGVGWNAVSPSSGVTSSISGTSATYTFPSSGTYTLSYTESYTTGIPNPPYYETTDTTFTQAVTVYGVPSATWFSTPPAYVYAGNSLTWQALASSPNVPVTSIQIHFDVSTNGGSYSANAYEWAASPSSSSNAITAGTAGTTYEMRVMVDDGTYGSGGVSGGTFVSPIYNTVTVATPVAVSPGSQTIEAGQSVGFTASNGANGYAWSVSPSGPSGLNGSGASQTVTFPSTGTYTVSAYSPSGGSYGQSNTATSTITVNPIPTSFSLSQTNFTYDGSAQGPTVEPDPSNATWSVTSGATSATSAGSYSVTATANGNYSGSDSLNWTIAKATPSLSWSTPAAITYGTALSSAQLDATASVGGSFSYSPASGTVLNAGTQTLSVTFTPSDTNDYNSVSGQVSLTVNPASQSVSISPSSQTIQAGQSVGFTASGGENGYAWGGSASGSGSTNSVTFPNVGTYTVTVYSPSGGNYSQSNTASSTITVNPIPTSFSLSQTNFTYDGSAQGPTVEPNPSNASWSVTSGATSATTAGSYSVTATANGNYSGSNSLSWTIGQATPSISWPAPSAITYGTALGAAQLDATASVAGTFSYSPASGTVLNAGTQTLSVTFTPNDTTDYTSATAQVSLTVNQAAPAAIGITPSSASAQAGGSVSFTASGGDSANGYVWSVSPSGPTGLSGSGANQTVTFPTVGQYTVSVYTPAGGNYLQSQTASATVNNTKATPTITWSNPAAITYGTALSGTQLDATANVSGGFSYSPASGTVLGAGNQTLSVTFTPNDTTDYNTATASVSLTVNPAAPPTVTVTPTSPSVQAGQSVAFTAANGENGYSWGGSASGTGSSNTVAFPNVGTYSVTVFSPAGGNYTQSNTAASSVTVTAIPASFTFSPSNLTLTYTGSAQGPTVIPSPSNATWSVTAGTASATTAGSYSFTATANGNYSGSSGQVNWSIAKATPSLSWSTPAAISYGTALSSTQLDAMSNVAGTFSYNYSSGAVLNAGSYTLTATFTPNDTTDYNTATASVSLTVNPAAPPTVTISPTSATVTLSGGSATVSFTASGGLNGYTWGGNASGSGSSNSVTFSTAGTFTVTVFSPAGGNYAQSNTATATITVNYPYVDPELNVLAPPP